MASNLSIVGRAARLLAAGAFLPAAAWIASLAGAGEPQDVLNNPAFIDVNVYAEAEIENALRLEREGRLKDALHQFLEVRRRFPDHLHLYPEDGGGLYALYVPIRAFVDRKILDFPPAVRAAHLEAIDPAASATFEGLRKAPRPDELRAFLDDYDTSSRGPAARVLLGDLLAERGDFLGALQAWQPLLERETPSASLVRRLGFCYRRLGFEDSLARLARRDLPGAADLAPRVARPAVPPGGPAPGFDPGTVEAALRWVVPLARIVVREEREKERTVAFHQGDVEGPSDFPPMLPRLWGDAVVLNSGVGLLALRLATGKLAADLPPLEREAEGDQDDDSLRKALEEDRRPYFVPLSFTGSAFDVATQDGLLVAVQFRFDSKKAPPEDREVSGWRVAAFAPEPRGQGLDLAPAWTWSPGLPSVLLAPTPTLEGGRVFVGFGEIAEGTRDIHQHVACLDARTGRELWRTFVSAFSGGAPGGEDSNLTPPSPPLVRHGMVFHSTNMGTVAALDAATGAPRWLFKYAIAEPSKPGENSWIWFTNPLVHEGETLIATPRDHPFPFALDPSTGRPLWSCFDEVRSAPLDTKNAFEEGEGGVAFDRNSRHSLGVSGGFAVFTAEHVVSGYRMSTGSLAWNVNLSEVVTGRGVLVRGRAWIPTRTGVVVLDLRTGNRVGRGDRPYLFTWAEIGEALRRTGGPSRADAPEEPGSAAMEEGISGGNLLVAEIPRTLCRSRAKDGKASCGGRPEPAQGGGLRCPACGRLFPSAEEVFVVVAGSRHVFCCALEPRLR